MESSITNNKFRSFLVLAKKRNVDEYTLARNPRVLSSYSFQKKGKSAKWLEVVVMTYLLVNKKDLISVVQVIQVLIFSVAQYFVFVLISCILEYAGQEKQ